MLPPPAHTHACTRPTHVPHLDALVLHLGVLERPVDGRQVLQAELSRDGVQVPEQCWGWTRMGGLMVEMIGKFFFFFGGGGGGGSLDSIGAFVCGVCTVDDGWWRAVRCLPACFDTAPQHTPRQPTTQKPQSPERTGRGRPSRRRGRSRRSRSRARGGRCRPRPRCARGRRCPAPRLVWYCFVVRFGDTTNDDDVCMSVGRLNRSVVGPDETMWMYVCMSA